MPAHDHGHALARSHSGEDTARATAVSQRAHEQSVSVRISVCAWEYRFPSLYPSEYPYKYPSEQRGSTEHAPEMTRGPQPQRRHQLHPSHPRWTRTCHWPCQSKHRSIPPPAKHPWAEAALPERERRFPISVWEEQWCHTLIAAKKQRQRQRRQEMERERDMGQRGKGRGRGRGKGRARQREREATTRTRTRRHTRRSDLHSPQLCSILLHVHRCGNGAHVAGLTLSALEQCAKHRLRRDVSDLE